MATISNTPRPGYVWDSTDNVWYPIGVGAHQHTNAADTPAVMPYSTYAAAGKNKILNGDFTINQRAFTSTTTSGTYMYDRWRTTISGGTATYTAQTFTPGEITGYESKNYIQIVTSGQSAVSDYALLAQKIEDVRTLAGQTVTVSFWAKASTGTPKVGVAFEQIFGTGGSSAVAVKGGDVTISSSWARYSVTFNLPSVTGKTISTSNDSVLIAELWTSAGSNYASAYTAIGIQNATISLWGVQVEAGSNVTAFQTATGNPASELAACQRYYWRTTSDATNATSIGQLGVASSTTLVNLPLKCPVTMRVKPASVDFSSLAVLDPTTNRVNVTAVALDNPSTDIASVSLTSSGLTAQRTYILYNQSAATGFIGFSAEL
jgi:hypothetical protein